MQASIARAEYSSTMTSSLKHSSQFIVATEREVRVTVEEKDGHEHYNPPFIGKCNIVHNTVTYLNPVFSRTKSCTRGNAYRATNHDGISPTAQLSASQLSQIPTTLCSKNDIAEGVTLC